MCCCTDFAFNVVFPLHRKMTGPACSTKDAHLDDGTLRDPTKNTRYDAGPTALITAHPATCWPASLFTRGTSTVDSNNSDNDKVHIRTDADTTLDPSADVGVSATSLGNKQSLTRYLAVGTRVIVAACLVTAALLEKFYFTTERLGLMDE